METKEEMLLMQVETLKNEKALLRSRILIAFRGLARIAGKCEPKARVIAEETRIRMKAVGA